MEWRPTFDGALSEWTEVPRVQVGEVSRQAVAVRDGVFVAVRLPEGMDPVVELRMRTLPGIQAELRWKTAPTWAVVCSGPTPKVRVEYGEEQPEFTDREQKNMATACKRESLLRRATRRQFDLRDGSIRLPDATS